MIKVFSDKYKSLLKEYYYIGGMPEVVESYVNYKDYNRVRKIQDEILLAYEKDFSKHVPEKDLILEGNKIFTEYKGSLTEQYVLGEIKSNYNVPITYWSNNAGQAEVDFVIQCKNEIIPIEVKAKENLQSKSLKVLAEKYKTKYNVRTSMADYKKNDWITNIPLYSISNIEKII